MGARLLKILVVDDDAELRGLIGFALRQAGYLVVETADGRQVETLHEQEAPDLIILDVNLPGIDGFELCRRIRSTSSTPILLLTVRSGEEDEVRGLDLGADDYLTKPFSPRTLLARVRALLRRADIEPRPPLAAGDFALDAERQTVTIRGGQPLRLTNLELRLLQLLLANAGRVVPTDRLISHVWGSHGLGDRQVAKQLVHRLRRKIERSPDDPKYLVTVAGTGYMLETAAQEDRHG